MDRLELKLRDHFLVIRIDVASDAGKYIREKYHGGLVPTFIIFDTRGNEVWRRGGSVPTLEEILSLNL